MLAREHVQQFGSARLCASWKGNIQIVLQGRAIEAADPRKVEDLAHAMGSSFEDPSSQLIIRRAPSN